jgi:hypothetical protein
MKNPSVEIPELTQHDLVSSYYDAVCECVDFVQKQIIPVLNGQLNLSQKEEAILGIFYRMHALTSSLSRLDNKLDFNAVATISRTVFELLLDIKILTLPSLTPTELDKFQSFAKIERFRKASKLLEFQAQNPGLETNSYFQGGGENNLLKLRANENQLNPRSNPFGELTRKIILTGPIIGMAQSAIGRNYLALYTSKSISKYIHY